MSAIAAYTDGKKYNVKSATETALYFLYRQKDLTLVSNGVLIYTECKRKLLNRTRYIGQHMKHHA